MKNKILPKTYYHPFLKTRDSHVAGRGSFAIGDIKKGERVIEWGGDPSTIITNKEFEKLFAEGKIKPDTAITFDEEHRWVQFADHPDDDDALINHSCDPNLWFDGSWALVACRDIKLGEELTFDYATGETHAMPGTCQCGSSECRGRVTGEEWKDPAFREKNKGHFNPYIQGLIDKYL